MKRIRKSTRKEKLNKDILYIGDVEYRRYFFDGISTDYFIGANGTVYSDHRRRLLSITKNHAGYHMVHMVLGNHKMNVAVHKLVALTFIGQKPSEVHQVDHVDGNKDNNHYTNLEWVTPSENIKRSLKLGLRKIRSGETHEAVKYPDALIIEALLFLKNGGHIDEAVEKFGISRSYISSVISGNTRKYLSQKVPLVYSELNGTRKKHSVETMDEVVRLRNEGVMIRDIMSSLGVSINFIYKSLKR